MEQHGQMLVLSPQPLRSLWSSALTTETVAEIDWYLKQSKCSDVRKIVIRLIRRSVWNHGKHELYYSASLPLKYIVQYLLLWLDRFLKSSTTPSTEYDNITWGFLPCGYIRALIKFTSHSVCLSCSPTFCHVVNTVSLSGEYSSHQTAKSKSGS